MENDPAKKSCKVFSWASHFDLSEQKALGRLHVLTLDQFHQIKLLEQAGRGTEIKSTLIIGFGVFLN